MPTLHPTERFVRGDVWTILGRLRNADGTPFNLNAGCAVQWKLRDAAGADRLSYSLNSGIEISDLPNAEILITVSKTDSVSFPAGDYFDQCRATDPDGNPSTQWEGPITVRDSFFES